MLSSNRGSDLDPFQYLSKYNSLRKFETCQRAPSVECRTYSEYRVALVSAVLVFIAPRSPA